MEIRPHSHFHLPWRMRFRPNNAQQSKCPGCGEHYSVGDAIKVVGDKPRFTPPYSTFYWKDHNWLSKRWYTPKQFRNKAYSHKETKCKDFLTHGAQITQKPCCSSHAWTMFVNIYLKSMRNRFQTTHNALVHLESGAYQTRRIMGTERAVEGE